MKTKQIVFLLILTLIIIIGGTNVYAASTSLSASSTSVEKGQSASINLSFTAAAWNLAVSGDKITGASYASQTSDLSEVTTTKTFPVDTSASGTYTITLYGDITDENGATTPINKSVTVTVTEPVVTPPPTDPITPTEPTTPTEPATPTTPTTPTAPTEPTFTSANKTMYSTGAINLRSTWSTSSSATKIDKDTELTVTGTSTDKVNGYVWYRVSYNGSTKYVASNLLTQTKPEETTNNANLKTLTVDGHEILPSFSANVTNYTMNVNNDTTELKITATTEDEKATVDIKGNKDLKEGDNVVAISVSAPDGTIKIYEIKVTRLEKTTLGLKSLNIKGTDISDKFKTDVYDYQIDIEDLENLIIEPVATDEKADVETIKSLEDDEKLITIIVKSEDGKETVTYQIKLNIIEEENNNTVETITAVTKTNDNSKLYLYGGISLIAAIILAIVIIFIVRNRKEEELYDEENDDNEIFEGFPEELPERPYDFEPRYKPYKKENTEENVINPFMKEYEQRKNLNQNNEEDEELNYDQNNEESFEEDNDSNDDDYYDDDDKRNNRKGKHF